MFGTFFGAIGLPVGILLLLMALAFGTTGVVFAAIIAGLAGIVLLAGGGLVLLLSRRTAR